MKILLDTNILIPLEPRAGEAPEATSTSAAALVRLILTAGHSVWTHEASLADIDRDRDAARANARLRAIEKYPQLPLLRPVPAEARDNDWVDGELLAAIAADAADLLVTEDRRILANSVRAGRSDRVLTVADAIDLLTRLAEQRPPPPPAVMAIPAFRLDTNDPIFDSFRNDYPGFDAWLAKCKRDHRQSWVVRHATENRLAAVAIVKRETDAPHGQSGAVLKICSFKVSHEAPRQRYGELLLKALLQFAHANRYDLAYVEVFEKQAALIAFLSEFGFEPLFGAGTARGELVLRKELRAPIPSHFEPLAHHRHYGPPAVLPTQDRLIVIPIRPHFHATLFPEAEEQRPLHGHVHSSGCALRKAYLCHSNLQRLRVGDTLAFYRSTVRPGLTVLGVLEDWLRADDAETIVRFVGNRTVYSFAQIRAMCAKPVLAIRFRFDRVLDSIVKRDELLRRGLVKSPPQTMTHLSPEAAQWIIRRANVA